MSVDDVKQAKHLNTTTTTNQLKESEIFTQSNSSICMNNEIIDNELLIEIENNE